MSLFITRETVETDTPALFATSLILFAIFAILYGFGLTGASLSRQCSSDLPEIDLVSGNYSPSAYLLPGKPGDYPGCHISRASPPKDSVLLPKRLEISFFWVYLNLQKIASLLTGASPSQGSGRRFGPAVPLFLLKESFLI